MRVILIDDEPLARSVVIEYLQSWPQIEIVQECSDGFEGVKAIAQHEPDLIFLDIQMPKINGFEMLELIDQPPSVIFTTAFDEYAIKAFEEHAIDYLLKPFTKERFDRAVQKWLDTKPTAEAKKDTTQILDNIQTSSPKNERVVVKTGNKIKIIPLNDIIFLAADDDYVKIHTAEGSFLKNKTMSYFEKLLGDVDFVRVHRSYIVKIDEITRIDPYEKESHLAILKSGEKIPVSKTGYPKLRQVLGL
ncbi:LytTR family transcriptional regulator DNA-binding domain-containing protein [Daejeonella sp. JGW-45]|uniref:LytR/AlgR family response regulator transcription factor n=1 Tax=Daejeonella sp. JGW-45 TaxID=3034148 RepID=UPI0023EB4557|nr:LytTR family transcriptional regulator DNA-binding domain-containing protein [Daejeonella sp. JGW-45]